MFQLSGVVKQSAVATIAISLSVQHYRAIIGTKSFVTKKGIKKDHLKIFTNDKKNLHIADYYPEKKVLLLFHIDLHPYLEVSKVYYLGISSNGFDIFTEKYEIGTNSKDEMPTLQNRGLAPIEEVLENKKTKVVDNFHLNQALNNEPLYQKLFEAVLKIKKEKQIPGTIFKL